jgi:hypothetical protein
MRITRRQFVAGAATVGIAISLPRWVMAADDGAVAFAKSLYALPGLWEDVTANDASIAKYLDPKLAALVKANLAKTDVESALDYDPLVQAQDYDDITTTFTVQSETASAATVDAHVNNYGEESVVTLELTNSGAGWRLANIRTDEESPSLLEELQQLNDETGASDD